MNHQTTQTLSISVHKLLKPLFRLLLRYGIPYQAFAELAKQAYVAVAEEDFILPGRKQSQSRIAVLTGLTRKEVNRIKQADGKGAATIDRLYNRATRVISGWQRDAEFHGPSGQPIPLPIEGEATSFRSLVERYSGDMPVRSTLDELLRTGAVFLDKARRVHLVNSAYIPEADEIEKLAILGADVADLINTIDRNVHPDNPDSYLQLKVCYDNLPQQAVKDFRTLSNRKSMELLQYYDQWLAPHDRDSDSHIGGKGRYRAGVGIYFFQQELSPPTEEYPS